MTIRFYIIPIERIIIGGINNRGPKYFYWKENRTGITDPWNMIDYGLIDQAVIASDITQVNHDSLVLNPDVYSFPVDLNQTMPQIEQNNLSSFLETIKIPGQWLSGTQTYRTVLRIITGVFLYIQRVCGIIRIDPTTVPGVTLNSQYQDLDLTLQSALNQAAIDLGYDFSGVSGNTTLRSLLKNMADQWGTRPIYIGITIL